MRERLKVPKKLSAQMKLVMWAKPEFISQKRDIFVLSEQHQQISGVILCIVFANKVSYNLYLLAIKAVLLKKYSISRFMYFDYVTVLNLAEAKSIAPR